MANIYELSAKYRHLQLALECAPDDEEIEALLDEADDEIEEKADGYARIIKNLEADIEAYKLEEERLHNRRKSLENNIKRMKSRLMDGMKATGKTKFKTDLFSFNVAKNGGKAPLEVTVRPEELPDELRRVVIEADNDAIREYIEATGDLSYGVIKERGESLRIR